MKHKFFISFVLFITLICLTSFNSKQDNDYILLNKILEKVIDQNKTSNIVLDINNNNETVISVVKKLKYFDEEKSKISFDSIRQEIRIYKDSKFLEIFNRNQYDYFISQKSNSEWDFNKVTNPKIIKNVKEKFTNKQVIVKVCKPIYTTDNKYALISISKKNSSYIVVFKKENNIWNEFKIFSAILN